MKKVIIALISVFLLSGCGVFERGNYEKDRDGFVIKDNLIVNYHTNSVGEIDIFMIDEIMSFFEALDYASFDTSLLTTGPLIDSLVTPEELLSCNIERYNPIPRYIRIGDKTYFYNIRDNDYCTYDEYEFGMSSDFIPNEPPNFGFEDQSPVQSLDIRRFKNADFTINPFEDILFIENIFYDVDTGWKKEIVSALPMSIIQSGSAFNDNSAQLEQFSILSFYVINNQSINLLELNEDYLTEPGTSVWSDDTIDVLGRDNEVVKKVKLLNIEEILDIINDTLGRLGMFQ